MHRLTLRVYYEDTDLAGIVYHANYLKFLERGRTEALRDAGVDQTRLKAGRGLVFVVVSMDIAFRAPARFDDILEVTTETVALRGATIEMAQAILRDGASCVTAGVRCALMDTATGRAIRLPEELRRALAG
jgi:acyl-CoA thioester hydrolase